MQQSNYTFISLGTNRGNRNLNLHRALLALEASGLVITALSPIYETPSWGFKSDSFYNACLAAKTTANPFELMEMLLAIEADMGRTRKPHSGYRDRVIDLDILFYNDSVIASPTLTIPHPQLHERNFVLTPLAAIAPELVHPLLQKKIIELSIASPDTSIVKALDFDLWNPPVFDHFPYIVIEGNIGAGKTTLTEQMASYYQVTPLFEAFGKNPHLKAFYEDPESAALAVETFFLEDRLQTGIDFWKTHNGKAVVADYSLYKSMIFATQNLSAKKREAYRKQFEAAVKRLPQPDLMVFLHQPIPKLLHNIEARGRSFEQNITASYLEKITEGYRNFLKQNWPFPMLEVDATSFDFKNSLNDFQRLMRKISIVGL